ncbi:nuclear transport factor 2 family protein [Variovorax dokdonensis]|uniref:Nuclear transport factor 2 family protein n=1 Tax=Variovorax dokdonensis TaxID=344883 RepID=A0ABT7N914_9BURK|nr:nuclear transport factor 2 family protein [Variovorax dokdonensis]MDM0044428.1 nuclear transport factor 2 family protein [Variovorax dokdonensis]
MNTRDVMPSRIEDEAACARLCVDFANHLDARRYDEVLELFPIDGVLDRMGTVFSGRQALRSFLDARATDVTTRHLCTNIRVRFEGPDDASGFCCVLFFQGRAGEGAAVALGPPSVVEYHDRFTRANGAWLIQERRICMAIRA